MHVQIVIETKIMGGKTYLKKRFNDEFGRNINQEPPVSGERNKEEEI